MHELQVTSHRRCELIDVTDQVAALVGESGSQASAVLLTVPHTTAGITINECADPSVAADILAHLEALVPVSRAFRHSEGNSDAHIKSTLVGSSVLVPIGRGRMALGTWQGIFFAEFDGPRSRRLYVTFVQ